MTTDRSTGGMLGSYPTDSQPLTAASIRENAFSMPYHAPSYGKPPSWYLDRPNLTVTYRTEPDRLRAIVPEPLEIRDPLVSLSFLHMVAPGIGDYYEFAQSVSCYLGDERLSFRPIMVAENMQAIMAGRESLGLPKKYGHPRLKQEEHSYVGTLEYNGRLIAQASMHYKFKAVDLEQARKPLAIPGVVLKIIPGVDDKPRVIELVRFEYDIVVKGAWTGPGSLELFHHESVPLAALPVLEIVSVMHTLSDMTLLQGKVVHDYLK